MDEMQSDVAEAAAAWKLWAHTDTNLRVDFVAGRNAEAEAFGIWLRVPYDLEGSPGVVLPYDRVAAAQTLGMATGLRAVALIRAADGLWYASLLRERAAASIEVSNRAEQWPAAAQGSAPLAYRVPISAVHRVTQTASR